MTFRKFLPWIDWLTAAASLAYGLVFQNMWALGGGVLGLVVAWTRPARLFERWFKAKLTGQARVRSQIDDSVALEKAESFYAESLEPVASDYRWRELRYGAIRMVRRVDPWATLPGRRLARAPIR